eukprot:6713031-Prymnesium_polylepis.1
MDFPSCSDGRRAQSVSVSGCGSGGGRLEDWQEGHRVSSGPCATSAQRARKSSHWRIARPLPLSIGSSLLWLCDASAPDHSASAPSSARSCRDPTVVDRSFSSSASSRADSPIGTPPAPCSASASVEGKNEPEGLSSRIGGRARRSI